MIPRFVFGSPGLILRGGGTSYYNSPISIGTQLPNLNSLRLPVCISRSRMLQRFPDLYDVEEGSNIYKDVTIEAEKLCEVYEEIGDIGNAHWIDLARGFAVDALGSLLGVVRRPGETDYQLKQRIKSKIPTMTGGGTIPHLQQLVAPILGCETTNVQINDGTLKAWHGPNYEYVLKLNGNANDAEGNHNGTEVGSPTYDDARFGDGLTDPDDSNYIRIDDDSAFDTGSFAIWAWVSPTDVSGFKYIKIKANGSETEWFLRIHDGKLEGYVNLVTTDATIDSGSTLLRAGRSYFVMMSYDDTTKKVTIYMVEDGFQNMMIRPDKWESSAGSGARVYGTLATPIYIGKNIVVVGQYWEGWIDHIGYVTDAVTDKQVDEICYCAPQLQHYAHFDISIINYDLTLIDAGDWWYAYEQVEKHKAAGVTFEGFSNGPRYENLLVSDDANYSHYSNITYTESLNETTPG